MNLQTATIYAKCGYKIYRPSWNSEDWQVTLKINNNDEWIFINTSNGLEIDCPFILYPDDCLADDWQLVPKIK